MARASAKLSSLACCRIASGVRHVSGIVGMGDFFPSDYAHTDCNLRCVLGFDHRVDRAANTSVSTGSIGRRRTGLYISAFFLGRFVAQSYVAQGGSSHQVQTKTKNLDGKIIRSGERGMLFVEAPTRNILFIKWDEIQRIVSLRSD